MAKKAESAAAKAWNAWYTAKKANQATAATKTTAITTSGPPVQPFLSPAQQTALNNWNTKYGTELAALTNKDVMAAVKMNLGATAAQVKNANSVNATNQTEAARGMFQSSIRDSALNDLASTLAQQENILHTNYQAALTDNALARTEAAGQNASTQAYYNELAVQNAQSVPPNVSSTTTSPSSAGATTTNTGKPTTNTAPGTTTPKPVGNTAAWQNWFEARRANQAAGITHQTWGMPAGTAANLAGAARIRAAGVGVPK